VTTLYMLTNEWRLVGGMRKAGISLKNTLCNNTETLKLEAVCSYKPLIFTYMTRWCYNPQILKMDAACSCEILRSVYRDKRCHNTEHQNANCYVSENP
jgi:hypothetical protein